MSGPDRLSFTWCSKIILILNFWSVLTAVFGLLQKTDFHWRTSPQKDFSFPSSKWNNCSKETKNKKHQLTKHFFTFKKNIIYEVIEKNSLCFLSPIKKRCTTVRLFFPVELQTQQNKSFGRISAAQTLNTKPVNCCRSLRLRPLWTWGLLLMHSQTHWFFLFLCSSWCWETSLIVSSANWAAWLILTTHSQLIQPGTAVCRL